jgi:hypothetical protein
MDWKIATVSGIFSDVEIAESEIAEHERERGEV